MKQRTFTALSCLLWITTAVWAQTGTPPGAPTSPAATGTRSTGSLHGTVEDTTGGIIPGATVTLMSPTGQVIKQTTAGADGSYTFRGIAPGTYSIVATYAGLQQQNPISVSINRVTTSTLTSSWWCRNKNK